MPQPCETPFGKNVDLCNLAWSHLKKYGCRNRAGRHLEKIWTYATLHGAIWKKYGCRNRAGRHLEKIWTYATL